MLAMLEMPCTTVQKMMGDEYADCFYEGVPKRLHLSVEIGVKVSQCNADRHGDEHLKPELKVPRLRFLALDGSHRCLRLHRLLPRKSRRHTRSVDLQSREIAALCAHAPQSSSAPSRAQCSPLQF
jgi:hypothetical protein